MYLPLLIYITKSLVIKLKEQFETYSITSMKIAITGHRPNKLWNDYDLISPGMNKIKDELQHIINVCKPDALISGMALGIDTLWAKLAVENNIILHAYIPFKGQESVWTNKSKDLYYSLLEYAKIKIYCSDPGFAAYKMQIRNEQMVNDCDLLIAVWDGTSGGTANCVKYAEFVKNERIIINPLTLTVKNISYHSI